MSISGSIGAKIYIGPTTAAATAQEYAALTYVEITGVETIGDFGATFSTVKHNPLSGAPTKKMKGSKDSGDSEIALARDPLDPGQIALMAALASRFEYAFKITVEDAADANDIDSVFYFHAIVNKGNTKIDSVDAVTKRNVTLGISSEIIEVPSVAVS
jgi:hypothetical protein